MLTPQVWLVLAWTSSFLWCRSCAQDECKDVADEEVRSSQAQAMFQKQVQQQKVRLFTGVGQGTVMINQAEPWKCTPWPTSTGTPQEMCENGNKLEDGREYLYNLGATETVAGACGLVDCKCCMRPLSTPTTTTTKLPSTTTATTTVTMTTTWKCTKWPTSTGTPQQMCENGNKLDNGNEYMYNIGATETVAGTCGLADCECCIRPLQITTTTTTRKMPLVTTTTTVTMTTMWKCTPWPTSTGTPKEKCENGNKLDNGYAYMHNLGATETGAGACGLADCECCIRPLQIATTTTTTKLPSVTTTTTAKMMTMWKCTPWPTSTGYPREMCENGNKLDNGYEYLYNLGATETVAGACGLADCECCIRPLETTTAAKLPSTTTTTTTFTSSNSPEPESTSCPAACHSPACMKGGRHKGGVPLDLNGKCNYHCSMEFSGTRYCGTGSEYTTGDSVDCSGCAVDLYVLAAYGAMVCPSGFAHLNDLQACQSSLTILGTEYIWGGGNHCRNEWWPREGCFTYEGKMYFSTCGADRPLSTWLHDAICKKLDGDAVTTSTTTAALTGCPAACHSPECVKGGRHNGGVPLDANGKCNYHCSMVFSGTRYCGTGSQYINGDTVDCSGCAVDPYIIAADGAMDCPNGYVQLNDLQACEEALTIHGTEYIWSGDVGCTNVWWPRAGCFTYKGRMYFSTCGTGRALSTWSHDGICERMQK